MESFETKKRRGLFRLGVSFAITASLFVFIPGCGSQEQWEITYENKGEVPCSFFIVFGGGSKASVSDVEKCEATRLIGMDVTDTVVNTV
jgi:hypothetical protein